MPHNNYEDDRPWCALGANLYKKDVMQQLIATAEPKNSGSAEVRTADHKSSGAGGAAAEDDNGGEGKVRASYP